MAERIGRAPRYRYSPITPGEVFGLGLADEYMRITGATRVSPKQASFIAACYRVHGPNLIALIEAEFARTGTTDNLLLRVRETVPVEDASEPPSEAASDAPAETVVRPPFDDPDELDRWLEEHGVRSEADRPVDDDGVYVGLTYGPSNRPPFDPSSKRRWARPIAIEEDYPASAWDVEGVA